VNPANPLLQNLELPAYALIEATHVPEAIKFLQEKHNEFINKCQSFNLHFTKSWDSFVMPMMELEELTRKVFSPVGHLNMVRNSDSLRKVYEDALPILTKMGLEMGQNRVIYDTLCYIKDHEKPLSSAQMRTLEGSIQSARLSGIDLDETKKARFNEIQMKLAQLSNQFSNSKLDAIKSFKHIVKDKKELNGMPRWFFDLTSETYNRHFTDVVSNAEYGPWCITLDAPVYLPIMEDCKNRNLREYLLKESRKVGSQDPFNNNNVVLEILALKEEQAHLLGFENYAALSLARKMAPNVAEIFKLQDDIAFHATPKAKEELTSMLKLAKESGETWTEMKPWDVAFWSKRRKEILLNLDEEVLKPYFPLEKVLEGLFYTLKVLFDLNISPTESDVSVWDPSVRFYDVKDSSGTKIAGFYLDPYSRPQNKQAGAWMDEVTVRSKKQGKIQTPVAHMVCNFTPPIGNEPSLLTLDQIETLFHEMGHALQHMLTQVDVPSVAGINGIEWDAVELPSQFMEFWLYQDFVLDRIGSHYQTQEKLPVELKNKIKSTLSFGKGLHILRQIIFGRVDLELHSLPPPSTSQELHNRYLSTWNHFYPVPTFEQDYMLCSFAHIFAGGYSAGYYSYLWADLLSNDAFGAFEEAGLNDISALKKVGSRFKDTVLGLGGSVHPMEVFEMFRGRKPQIEPLLKHNGFIH